jgi:NADH-quinone oxidoreductase subunit J
MSPLAQAATGGAGTDTAEVVLFWLFAVIALGSAVAVITMRNVVHGALMLVLNLLAIAGLFLALGSQFLSIIQVLVYAGAIMVLFLFVIMLLGVDRDDLLMVRDLRTTVLAVAGSALLAGALLVAFVGPYTSAASVCGAEVAAPADREVVRCVGLTEVLAEDDGGAVAFLGDRLFRRYTYAFELAALLLTVATIGAVIMARRRDLLPEDDPPPAGGPDPDASPEAVAAELAGDGLEVPASDPAGGEASDRHGREG